MKGCHLAISAAALIAFSAPSVYAQYKVRALDFDIWCTEEEHIPYERCEKRVPEDVQKFEAYRTVIERYEIPDLQERDRKLHIERTLLHNDPIDGTQVPQSQEEHLPTDGKSP
jgi:hypothetical protein